MEHDSLAGASVGVMRFERTTSCTQSRPSTRLRYTPDELGSIYTVGSPRQSEKVKDAHAWLNRRANPLPSWSALRAACGGSAREGAKRDLQPQRCTIGSDEPVPGKVAVALHTDAVSALGEAHPSGLHDAQEANELLVDVDARVPRCPAAALQLQRHGGSVYLTAERRAAKRRYERGQTCPSRARPRSPLHSHSMVPGGFELMSYVTRLIPSTSLMIRVLMVASRS